MVAVVAVVLAAAAAARGASFQTWTYAAALVPPLNSTILTLFYAMDEVGREKL